MRAVQADDPEGGVTNQTSPFVSNLSKLARLSSNRIRHTQLPPSIMSGGHATARCSNQSPQIPSTRMWPSVDLLLALLVTAFAPLWLLAVRVERSPSR
ncbi:MAG: hypothetical protein JWN44_4562 [Myxococcales bacterium]|nr:hypothetical protein [Myxococcales bacterium]